MGNAWATSSGRQPVRPTKPCLYFPHTFSIATVLPKAESKLAQLAYKAVPAFNVSTDAKYQQGQYSSSFLKCAKQPVQRIKYTTIRFSVDVNFILEHDNSILVWRDLQTPIQTNLFRPHDRYVPKTDKPD